MMRGEREEKERERERKRERERNREGERERARISHRPEQAPLSLKNDPLGQWDWR